MSVTDKRAGIGTMIHVGPDRAMVSRRATAWISHESQKSMGAGGENGCGVGFHDCNEIQGSSSSQASISFDHKNTVCNVISALPNGYGEILTTDSSLSMGIGG